MIMSLALDEAASFWLCPSNLSRSANITKNGGIKRRSILNPKKGQLKAGFDAFQLHCSPHDVLLGLLCTNDVQAAYFDKRMWVFQKAQKTLFFIPIPRTPSRKERNRIVLEFDARGFVSVLVLYDMVRLFIVIQMALLHHLK